MADLPRREDAYSHLQRLLKEDAEETRPMIEATQKAIDETRELLARVSEDHPEIP